MFLDDFADDGALSTPITAVMVETGHDDFQSRVEWSTSIIQ
ncbi:MAG: hypothetical protein AAF542_19890 [Pseudomonadota bacterium]